VTNVWHSRQPRSAAAGPAHSLLERVRADSLLRNSIFILLTTVVNSAFGFVFWLLAARLFPASVVGLTAALISAGTIVVLLGSIGVGGTLIQSLPGDDRPAGWRLTLWAGMAVAVSTSLVLGFIAIVVLPRVSGQLTNLGDARYIAVFAVGTVAMTAGAIVDYAFLAERVAGRMLGRNSAVAAGKVVAAVLLTVVAGSRALDLLSAWSAAAVVGLVLGLVLLTRHVRPGWPPRPSALFRRARVLRGRMAGQQLIGMGGALLPYLLPVLVTARLSARQNAYFYTTWMLAGLFLIIAPAVSLSLFAEGAHSPHELRAKAISALKIVIAILVPGIAGVLVLGGFVLAAFGHAYEQNAAGLLRIVLLASVPDALNNVYVAVLRVRGRLATAAALNLSMAGGIVVLSWFLLPSLGIDAVGWTFLAMQLCGCVFVGADLIRQARLVSATQGGP
jgi:O-antigen/teichoic acid export membrane protein